jgi:hypothetical protein
MRRLLFLIAILIFGVISTLLYINKDNIQPSLIPPEVLKHSRFMTIFKLENDSYISFPLLSLTDEIRIATNAEFSPNIDLRQSSNREIYTIEVGAYNYSGKLVDTRRINYATKAQFYFSKDLGMYLSSYFLDSDNLPGETRVGRLNFKDIDRIATIRLKRVDDNQNLINIYARVYQKGAVSENRLNFYWLNIMKQDQKRLAAANLYPVDMLRKTERLNLMRNLWTVVTPSGVPGQDFHSKKLYNINKPVGIPYDINLLHSGNYIDDLHSVIIPINEDASDINVNIISADIIYPRYMKIWLVQPQDNIVSILKLMQQEQGDSALESKDLQFIPGQKAEITWRGRGLGRTQKYQVDLSNRYFSTDYKFDAGSVVVSSNMPAYVNISKKTDAGLMPIMTEPSGATLVRLRADSYVEYEIFHDDSVHCANLQNCHLQDDGRNTSFRVDLRLISQIIFDSGGAANVDYEFIDRAGAVISSGVIEFPHPATEFDFTVSQQGLHISERSKYYFLLPANVTKIRFKGEGNIFISAYNRLDSFVRHFIIPTDYKISQDKEESLRRTWFFKEPVGFEDLRSDLRTIFVKSQNKITEENELIKEGIYDWKEILPKGVKWTAVEVAERKSSAIVSRSEAEGVEFSQIPINKDYEIEFAARLGGQIIAPTVMYSGDIGTKISIYLDDRGLIDTAVTNPNGQINLSNVIIGKHVIHIKTDKPIKAFLNYLKEDQDSDIKHNILSFNEDSQEFAFEKTIDGDQVITLKTYSLTKNQKTLMVDIIPESTDSLVTALPLPSYTIKKRKYEIEFTREPENVKFIDNKQVPLYGAEPIFIKLGSDLKKGKYNINLKCNDYMGFYAALSSITAGLIDNRVISTEVEDEE